MAHALASRIERAAKRSGLKVVWVAGWESRGHGTMGSISTITLHHTGTPRTFKRDTEYPTYNVVKSGRPGLPGPLAHYGLGRTGTLYVFAAGIAYHAGKSRSSSMTNSHAIGIEAEGAMEDWPKEQYQAYLRLVRALLDEFDLDESRALRHAETCSPPGRKPDASFSGPAFRKELETVTLDGSTPKTETKEEGLFGMTDRITGWRSKDIPIPSDFSIKQLPITNPDSKGNTAYSIVTGPATFDVGVRVEVTGLDAGETAELHLFEWIDKPNQVGRTLDKATLHGGTEDGWTHGSVHASWTLPKEYKGGPIRVRVGLRTRAKGVTVRTIETSGIRD